MIRRLFASIAPIYDRINRLLSLGLDRSWRRRALALVPSAPATLVDLACGTGAFTLEAARRFPCARITGIDLTPEMLAHAREKGELAGVRFLEGDMQNLDALGLSPCDLLTCAFGFRNVPDRSVALRQSHRLLVVNGKLLVLEFFRPSSRLLSALVSLWIALSTRVLGRTRRDAYAHLRHSIRTTDSREEFVSRAHDAGFSLVTHRFFFPCCTALLFSRNKVGPSSRHLGPSVR